MLLCFAAAALGIQALLPRITFRYGRFISSLAAIHSFELAKQASIAVRPLTIAIIILFAAFSTGSVAARVRLAGRALLLYLPLMILLDILLARLARYGGPGPFSTRGNILNGVLGIIAIALAVFSDVRLPPKVDVPRVLKRPRYYAVVLVACLAAAVVTIWALFHYESRSLHWLSHIPLLGGLLSVVVLFFALFPAYLCLCGYVIERARRHSLEALEPPDARPGAPLGGEPPIGESRAVPRAVPAVSGPDVPPPTPLSFGFIVPAHNEEGRVGHCIRAMDNAAGEWPGETIIYVVENGSTDNTYEEARAALDACRHARGVLLTSATEYKTHAKAHALNTGLFAATEDIVVRVDADTFVSRSILRLMAPYFEDPRVGGVGALPLPHKLTIWIERMRAVEVYYGAAFKRTAQGAVDAIPVLPGATVAYRRDLLVQLGGIAEGMLGEDADITMRVGRLGYQIISDPAIKTYSEQPQNFRELREQRMRWSFGLFNSISRNRDAIFGLDGLRGIWIMPWAIFVMFRKLILIPFAVAVLGLILLDDSLFPLHEIAAAGAIALGAQLLVMAVVVSILGGPSRVISLPSYIVFRLIVTYFSLETLLTAVVKEPHWWTAFHPAQQRRLAVVGATASRPPQPSQSSGPPEPR
jgi:cellulose synthase/poly-beta-1,6-N-acetylglucosamine synthase-like glycosyltransferase